ncbi:hypothetical protein [Epilithonimonas hispanica]|uniref:O-antigen ligase-like membrane protein n=1 Tax=Epilithonimonas hispanica TaxID=358687 RepID=A0A3D9CQS2_9FLAO|nr:hypothetical protein [Epilithonimonas hispanica]REC68104.1 hypothetical protein DRF58_14490 [Epilithonimonas hispanica]
MKINVLKIDYDRSVQDKIRLCFWLYLFFLIFESAFRKWFLPGLSNIFLVIRDPIVLYVLILGLHKNLTNSKYVVFLIALGSIAFFTTLIWGHQNFLVDIYGFRIIGIYFPAMFVFSKSLKRYDLLIVGKVILYLSFFMTILITLQYFSPQSSWVNRGIGGNEEGAGFAGVGGYFRPSGTFSFISGMVGFEFLVGAFLMYFLFFNANLPKSIKIPRIFLVIITLSFGVSIIVCLSRSIIFQSLILLLLAILAPLFLKKDYTKIFNLSIVLVISVAILSQINFFRIAVNNLSERFENASDSEGNVVTGTIQNRFLGSYERAFTDTQNFTGKEIPFTGFGLGIGTKVGEKLLGIDSSTKPFAVAEEEWSRVICEMGLLMGGLFLIVIRVIFPFSYSIKAFNCFRRNEDYLPYFFIPPFFIFISNRQLAMPNLLGFTVLFGIILLASINTSKKLSK